MMSIRITVITVCSAIAFSACAQTPVKKFEPVIPSGTIVYERFAVPDSFVRVSTKEGSFERFLQTLPLKPHGSAVKYYDGSMKSSRGVYLAVVDWPVGDKDLLQCADAVIKIRAEYLYGMGKQHDVAFNFTNGFRCEYSKFSEGNRIGIDGHKTWWMKKAVPSDTRQTFEEYLELVYTYAGTISLRDELVSVPWSDMQIGDVLIQAGSPGHAVIVVDMARKRRDGQALFLLAQSYMPAQEIQILVNPADPSKSPWYEVTDSASVIETPEWTFYPADVRRF